ncbi:hypothetical protein SK128_010669 [Halocaridina rubra]|uniref:DNA/RNA non-specific endonuclease/pyrophosphatase/phosphodiesterase domain-containing protein n=1 Tax=Halocaridina rubra TaxID=373956 RepID=A0AAN8WFW5_HALRR
MDALPNVPPWIQTFFTRLPTRAIYHLATLAPHYFVYYCLFFLQTFWANFDICIFQALAKQMIDSRKQYYFAKGHMAPDADFVTEAEQDATYYYINAVPQWQAFNNGNWKYLEFATRDLAEKRSTDMTIYSGSWGVLELDDINENPVDIYLGLSAKERVVPAPALNWKVIYEESSESAVAVVGINNPHISTPPEPLCKNICPDLPWIDFKTEDLGHGYTYCCDVNDLRKFIPIIPDLGKVHLLGHSSVELPSCRLYGI